MSRFPDSNPKTEPVFPKGAEVGGAFECDVCSQVATSAINNRQEGKLYWVCPQGHENSINFRL